MMLAGHGYFVFFYILCILKVKFCVGVWCGVWLVVKFGM